MCEVLSRSTPKKIFILLFPTTKCDILIIKGLVIMEQIKKYLTEHQSDMLDDLRSLVEIPSVRDCEKPDAPFGENCARVIKRAEKMISDAGFKTKNTGNYILTADLGDDVELGILCHLDVVPDGSGWTYPSYELTLDGDRLYGRGTIDNKGPAIAAFYAMKAIKASKIPLRRGVRLILGSDEENGSSDLEKYQKTEKLPSMLFTPDGDYPVINIEKGMARFSLSADIHQENCDRCVIEANGGKTINAVPAETKAVLKGFSEKEISFAAKNLTDVSITVENRNDDLCCVTVRGKNAHASTPELGVNAVTALLTLLDRLNVQGEVYEKLSALLSIFPHGETDGAHAGLKSHDELSGDLTLAFTVLNAVENSVTASLDIRFPICERLDGVINKLREKCEKIGFKLNLLMGDEPHHVPENSEFVQTLLRVYETETGDKGYCKAIGGGTYVHNTAGGVAFGAEFPGEVNNMHSADESIKLESLMKNAEIIARAIVELCK